MNIIIGNKSLREENKSLQLRLDDIVEQLAKAKAEKGKILRAYINIRDLYNCLTVPKRGLSIRGVWVDDSAISFDANNHPWKSPIIQSNIHARAIEDRDFYQFELAKAIAQRDYYKGICQNIAKKLETWEKKLCKK